MCTLFWTFIVEVSAGICCNLFQIQNSEGKGKMFRLHKSKFLIGYNNNNNNNNNNLLTAIVLTPPGNVYIHVHKHKLGI